MSKPKAQYTVLFVDDEQRVIRGLKAIFRRDYKVFIANSGSEALTIMEEHSIDVLVSDQRMPKMQGSELLAIVSRMYPQTMRILLTGFMDRQAIIDSINEGEVYRFINKPWDNDEISEIIAEAALASELPLGTMFKADGTIRSEDDETFLAATKNKAIVMFEKNQDVRNQIRKFCSRREIMIYSTQTVEQVISTATSRNNVGVAIFELSGQVALQTIQAINLLKQTCPEVMTIVLTKDYDARMAVDLINQGQVFKYLSRPIDLESLYETIDAAFRRHLYLEANESLQQRYRVSKTKGRITASLQGFFELLLRSAT